MARFYTHFLRKGRRPYIEDHSLQLFYSDSVEGAFNVKQLYYNFKWNSYFVSSEYEASLQSIKSLEREIIALQTVAKELQKAYKLTLN